MAATQFVNENLFNLWSSDAINLLLTTKVHIHYLKNRFINQKIKKYSKFLYKQH